MDTRGEDGGIHSQNAPQLELESPFRAHLPISTSSQRTILEQSSSLATPSNSLLSGEPMHVTDAVSHLAMSQPKSVNFDAQRVNSESVKFFSSIKAEFESVIHNSWFEQGRWSVYYATAVTPGNNALEVQEMNAPALRMIAETLANAHSAKMFKFLTSLLKTLADAVAREDLWRVQFGECDIVDQCAKLVETAGDSPHSLWPAQAVRLLGNCCGDPTGEGSADLNKARVVAKISLPLVIKMLQSADQYTAAICLVYNIGVDNNVMFQTKVIRMGLYQELVRLLNQDCFTDLRGLEAVCEMLLWAPTEDSTIPTLENVQDALKVILSLTRRCTLSVDNIISITEVISVILEKSGLNGGQSELMDLLTYFLSTYSQEIKDASKYDSLTLIEQKPLFTDCEEELSDARKDLINKFGQIALRDESIFLLDSKSKPILTLVDWLTAAHPQVQICALVILGNIAYSSAEAAARLLQNTKIAGSLAMVLRTDTNGLVLQAAFGTLQNLARSSENKRILAQLNVMEATSRSWSQESNSQLRNTACASAEQLLHKSISNARNFLRKTAPPDQSLMHRLVRVFKVTKDEESRIQMGLIAKEVWHTIYTDFEVIRAMESQKRDRKQQPQPEISKAEDRPQVEQSEDNAEAVQVAALLTEKVLPTMFQTCTGIIELFLPLIQSEKRSVSAWFTLALMAKHSEESADPIYAALCSREEHREVFRSALLRTNDGNGGDNVRAVVVELKEHFTAKVKTGELEQSLMDEYKGRLLVLNGLYEGYKVP